jgi:hypothetical protein
MSGDREEQETDDVLCLPHDDEQDEKAPADDPFTRFPFLPTLAVTVLSFFVPLAAAFHLFWWVSGSMGTSNITSGLGS